MGLVKIVSYKESLKALLKRLDYKNADLNFVFEILINIFLANNPNHAKINSITAQGKREQRRQYKMMALMFKNITTLAKIHLLHSTGTCRIPMTSDTLNSFTLFSESLLKLLLPINDDEKFYESIDILSMLAFSNLQLPHYCHKNITSSGILLEV